jgi:ABC-2 type transport system permease protein
MNKIFTITLKELGALTDRNLLLLMFAAPLALSTIIAVTFGGLFSNDGPIRDIPVAIVNQDEGGFLNNNGAILTGIFIPQESDTTLIARGGSNDCGVVTVADEAGSGMTMDDLVNAVALDDPAAARAGVDDGTYAAAIIIPPDFSSKLAFSPTQLTLQPTQVEVYGNPRTPIAASIIRSIVESIVTGLGTGNVAIAAMLQSVIQEYGPFWVFGVTLAPEFGNAIGCAFTPGITPISIDRESLNSSQGNIHPLVVFGAPQAIFFALFAANGFASTIMEERRNGTLQRMLVSPTSRLQILLGKMSGTFAVVVVQLITLLAAFTLVAWLLSGEFKMIWGTNLAGILVVVLATSAAVTGLGAIVAAGSKTPEQAGNIGSVISIAMAVFGGTFGFIVGPPLSYFSINYWGMEAFIDLAQGSGEFWLSALVMLIFGIVTFSIGMFIFNRRVAE